MAAWTHWKAGVDVMSMAHISGGGFRPLKVRCQTI